MSLLRKFAHRNLLRAVAAFFFSSLPLWGATTYYVAASGSDSNNGTSESTPWAHIPGMATWTGSYTSHAGDTIIVRGCDVWTVSNFPITWSYAGTSGSPIVVNGDGDPTWYNTANCASSWNRPVFNLGSTQITAVGSSGSFVFYFDGAGAQYTTFKWFEIENFFWNGTEQCCGLAHSTSNADYVTLSNLYFHASTHGGSAQELDYMWWQPDFAGAGNAQCVHCALDHNVFNNLDGEGANCGTGTGCAGGGIRLVGNFTNNVCVYWNNCFHGPTTYGPLNISGNYFAFLSEDGSISNASHPNAIETTGALAGGDGSGTTTANIHDNYICCNFTGEGLQVGNGTHEVDYVYNNIWDMGSTTTAGENGPQIPQNSTAGQMTGSSVYFWNNTVRWTAQYCATLASALAHGTDLVWTINFANNLCVTSAAPITTQTNGDPLPPGAVVTPNTGISVANASTYYPTTGTYPFAPASGCTSANCTGFGVGTNLTSTTPGCGTSGLSGLCSDTTYSVTQQTVNGVVEAVDSGRVVTPRPSSGAWDAGAFESSQGAISGTPGLSLRELLLGLGVR
jgi:hypothetical protein